MNNYDYTFIVYAEFFVCITLFGLVINTVLLKFSKTLSIGANMSSRCLSTMFT